MNIKPPEDERRFNFTKAAVEALPAPVTGRAYYRDTSDLRLHLGLAVTPLGAKTFFVQRRVSGRPVRMSLGRFPEVTVAEARRKAGLLNLEVAAGADPYERTRPARTGLTFGEFFTEEYIKRHARPHKRTWAKDEALFKLHLKPLASVKLGDIRRRDVQRLHVEVGAAAGHRTANMSAGLVRHVFKLAMQWGFYEGSNPGEGIRKFRECSRERFLQPEEVPAFFDALNRDADVQSTTVWRDFFLLALFTGARRSNLLAMRWVDVDLDRATWTIPGNTTKTGRSYALALPRVAVELLKNRRCEVDEDCPWVFPGRRADEHMIEPKSAWERIRKLSGLTDLRIHDLRRTLGSWQAAAGASLPIIGRSLGHANPGSTAVYARLSLDPVRASIEQATTALVDAARQEPSSLDDQGKQTNGRST